MGRRKGEKGRCGGEFAELVPDNDR